MVTQSRNAVRVLCSTQRFWVQPKVQTGGDTECTAGLGEDGGRAGGWQEAHKTGQELAGGIKEAGEGAREDLLVQIRRLLYSHLLPLDPW